VTSPLKDLAEPRLTRGMPNLAVRGVEHIHKRLYSTKGLPFNAPTDFYTITNNSVIKVKYFSTTISCLASPVNNNEDNLPSDSDNLPEGANSNNNNLPSDGDNLPDGANSNHSNLSSPLPVSDNNSPSSSGGESGYRTDSLRSYFEEGADAMVDHPTETIPEDHLRRYIRDLRYIVSNPYETGLSEEPELAQEYIRRSRDLREELRFRKDEGMIPDSSSDSGATEYDPVSSDSSDAGISSDVDRGTSDGVGVSSGDIEASTSSTNKRKFEEDGESSTQPSKSFKQYSSDISGDTEPYDFMGGEDS